MATTKDDQTLFDLHKPAKPAKPVTPARTKKAPLAPPEDVRAIIGRYLDLFQQKFGERPSPITNADAALIARLLATHGRPRVLERLTAFMALDDDFIREGVGWTIKGLVAKWNWLTGKLAVRTPAVATCTHVPRCRTAVAHGKRTVAEMKRRV